MAYEGAALGGGIGAVVGLVGGIVEGVQQRAENSRLRRRFRKGVAAGEARTERETYDILNSPEYGVARSFALGTYGIQAPSSAAGLGNEVSFAGKSFLAAPTGYATSKGDARIGNQLAGRLDQVLAAQRQLAAGVDNTGKPLDDAMISRLRTTVDQGRSVLSAVDTLDSAQLNAFSNGLGKAGINAQDFQRYRASTLGQGGGPQVATQTLDGGLETPLTRQFRSNLNQSMVSRGIYDSNAAAAAEASGLAAFQYQQQREMIPQMLQLASFGSDAYHRYESANISREVQRATGGVGVFGAANPFVGGSPVVQGIQGALSGGFSGASLGINLQNAFSQDQFNTQYLDMLKKQRVG